MNLRAFVNEPIAKIMMIVRIEDRDGSTRRLDESPIFAILMTYENKALVIVDKFYHV